MSVVEPIDSPLIVEPGRSQLLRFPQGVRRTALSNTNYGEVVQISPKEVLVIGRKPGVATMTVWPADPAKGPTVVLLRVQQRSARRP